MNTVRNAPCNTVTNTRTHGVASTVRSGVRGWVQNQSQNQRFWLLKSLVACGTDFHPSSRPLRAHWGPAFDPRAAATDGPPMDALASLALDGDC